MDQSQRTNNDDSLLFSGYFREFSIEFQIQIPPDIQNLIQNYLPLYSIHGKGGFANNTFSNHDNTNLFVKFDEMEKHLCHWSDLYCNHVHIIIKSFNDTLLIKNVNDTNTFETVNTVPTPQTHNAKSSLAIENNKYGIVCNGVYNSHTFIQSISGDLYVTGGNNYGQFGNGKLVRSDQRCWMNVNRSFLKNKNEKITNIHCGYSHTIFLTSLGFVYSCGRNDIGQCGLGPHFADNQLVPTLVELLKNYKISFIAGGSLHTFAMDQENNSIYGFGSNSSGQLGMDTSDGNGHCNLLKYFKNENIKIVDIKCGDDHSLFLDEKGNIHTCGNNTVGNCGNGKWLSYKSVRQPYKLEYEDYEIDCEFGIIDFDCGLNHNILLNDRNEVITFGDNNELQCSILGKHNNCVHKPHFLSKTKEIGIKETDYIEKVIAFNDISIVIVNLRKQSYGI